MIKFSRFSFFDRRNKNDIPNMVLENPRTEILYPMRRKRNAWLLFVERYAHDLHAWMFFNKQRIYRNNIAQLFVNN